MSKQSFLNGALILMVAGFIVKILGFFYRIYLSNLLGSQGMGILQLITPIYSLIIITLTSGISITVSSLVSYEFAKKEYHNSKTITNIAMILLFISSLIISILLYIFLKDIVNIFLKDNRTFLPLLVFVPALPFITLSSALKGYFYGISNVTPPAIAQIIEQLIKIFSVIFLMTKFKFLSISYACTLVMIGMIFSEFANLLVLLIFYKKEKFKKSSPIKKRKVIKDILISACSISLTKLITSIMSTLETIFIPSKLILHGLTWDESITLLGKLFGMAMPLILFPCLVTNSISTTIIPAISEGLAKKNYKLINSRISKSISLSSILGFIFMITFMTFPYEIGNLIYKKENIGDILYLLSFSCILLYLNQIFLATLNGLNKQTFSLISSVICYGIRIFFVIFIIPQLGMLGYILGFISSLIISCVLNLSVIIKNTGLIIDLKNWILKPTIVSIIMLIINKYIYNFFDMLNLTNTKTTILTIGTSLSIFCSFILSTGAISINQVFAKK